MQNKILKAIVSVMVIAMAGIVVFLTITTNIPVLKTTVNANDIITAEVIQNKRVVKTGLPEATVTKDIDLVGKKALITLNADSAILNTQVVTPTTAEGVTEVGDDMTILSIAVGDGNAPADVKAGDLVNILAYFPSGTIAGQGSFITGYNTIYTVNKINKNAETGVVKSIDIVVPKKEAVSVLVASSMGRVFLIKNSNMNDIDLGTMGVEDVYMNNIFNKAAADLGGNTSGDEGTMIEGDEVTEEKQEDPAYKQACQLVGGIYDVNYELKDDEKWYNNIPQCMEIAKSNDSTAEVNIDLGNE